MIPTVSARTWMKVFGLVAVGSLATFASSQIERRHIRIDDAWKFREDPLVSASASSIEWKWKPSDATSLDVKNLPSDIASGTWQPAKDHQDLFHQHSGFAWLTADLTWTKAGTPAVLHFEGIDDNAAVFINGKFVKSHEGWNEPFDVPLAGVWNSTGPNVAVVLVQNENGGGGLNGPSELQVATQAIASPAEAEPEFNDSDWATVHLPHDYIIDNKFDKNADTGHGSLPLAPAWYRRPLILPSEFRNRSVWISFDGVYRDSKVYLNGHLLGIHPSGYTSFRYDLTRYANFGGRNEIAVRVDPRRTEGWWYEGGGIYRHVWLNTSNKVHVRPWGTYVQSTVSTRGGVAVSNGHLTVQTTVDNNLAGPQTLRIKSQILSPAGAVVTTAYANQQVNAFSSAIVKQPIEVPNPLLWSLDNPNLYHVRTTISRNGQDLDRVETTFGIRSIEFDANKGFLLNGISVKIKGTCNHQDHAGVGIGIPDSLLAWRIRKLKSMGSNAYRCSHNPVAAELLDDCDRIGMLVMDENRHLGDTETAKSAKNTGYSDLSELTTMVTRDRNHPSIIIWSMCNEEGIQGTPEGARIFKAMADLTKSLDPTRPISCAMNGGWGTGISLVEDLQGINYGIYAYDKYHADFPTKPVYGSETASAVSTRGEYTTDAEKGYVSAYDVNRPGWGATAEDAWTPIAERPWFAGGFVWTGFDYKGEPTPYGWPCINSHFGILDICGFPKDSFYYYQSVWGDKPMVHILPHWNWSAGASAPVDVWCYSNGDRVELFLNNQSLGSKPVPAFGHVSWSVPYQPGELVAKAYRGTNLVATDTVATTGPAAAIRLKTERQILSADGEDVSLIEVQVVDSTGRVVPSANNAITFAVEGPAKVVGVGNGDPSSHEPDRANSRTAFHGLCMALVGGATAAGKVVLTASSPGLASAQLKFEARSAVFK